MNGHFYILREREFIALSQPVYKIGRSGSIFRRITRYPNGSKIIMILECDNMFTFETTIIDLFTRKFNRRLDIGREYFEGNITQMIKSIMDVYLGYAKFKIGVEEKEKILELKKEHKKMLVKVNKEVIEKAHEKLINEGKFICKKCNREFKSGRNLLKHQNRKIPCDRELKCDKCGKIFRQISDLKRHQNAKRDCSKKGKITGTICTFCKQKYSTTNSLKRHLRTCKIKKLAYCNYT